MNGEVITPYAISLVGFKPNLVIKPLLSQISSVKTVVLFHTENFRSLASMSSIIRTLNEIGIKTIRNEIKDMFNFFEIFMSAEYYRSNYGDPSWVNTTAGPGLGASALTMFASLHGADLISYDEGKDETRIVHLGELNELLQCSKKFKGLLGELYHHDRRTMEEICSVTGISKSTASRQLKILHNLGLIDVSGSGRGRSPFNISLTVWGKQFCQYSGCY